MKLPFIKRYRSTIYGNYKLALLKYGLLTGVVLCLVVLFRKLIYYPIHQPITYTEDIALLICMFLFTYLYRKKLAENKLFFKEVYVLNLGIGVVAGIIYGLFIVVYAKFISTDLCQLYYDSQAAVYEKANLVDNDLATRLEELKLLSNPKNLGLMSFILIAVLSLIFAMIVGIFMRTEKNVVYSKTK